MCMYLRFRKYFFQDQVKPLKCINNGLNTINIDKLSGNMRWFMSIIKACGLSHLLNTNYN